MKNKSLKEPFPLKKKSWNSTFPHFKGEKTEAQSG